VRLGRAVFEALPNNTRVKQRENERWAMENARDSTFADMYLHPQVCVCSMLQRVAVRCIRATPPLLICICTCRCVHAVLQCVACAVYVVLQCVSCTNSTVADTYLHLLVRVCSVLQRVVACCSVLQSAGRSEYFPLFVFELTYAPSRAPCITLQHTAPQCNTRQHTTIH